MSNLEKIRNKNINANRKFLKDLGFTSTRKFDRHVPNVIEHENVTESSDTDSDESEEEESERDLVHGEEVYLISNNKEVLKAKYDAEASVVHGVEIKEGEGRFFITKILRAAAKWDNFDIETMSEGAAILWNKKDIKQRSSQINSNQGTEANAPTPLAEIKRKRHPEEWKVNKKRKAVNSGKEFNYTVKTKSKGEITKAVKEKVMKPPCNENCRLKCREKFPEEIRRQIFESFYASGDRNVQTQQLATLVTERETARKRGANPESSRRNFSREYSLMKKGERIKVCQKMFLSTFAIDEKRIRTVLHNITETGTPLPDGRGRHNNHRREEQRTNYVMEHISTFKVLESHYVRREAKYEYLPSELTISQMYRMYLKWREEKNYPLETYGFYARIFRERFNLKFQKPKKDKCDTCEEFKNTPNPTEEAKLSQKNHLKDKDLARNIKQAAKEEASKDLTKCAAAFDLQKVLLTPYGQTSSFYYSRRLANHNFTVTELDSMSTWCYFWSESECQKGSCEVATSLEKFISARNEIGIKKFHFFSDRCGGQNNNRMVFVMLNHVLHQFDLDNVRLTYLVSGHSQSENDTAHSVIERMAESKTVYTPSEWHTLIECAFKKNKCTLKVLEHGDVKDYKNPTAFPEYATVYSDKTEEEMTNTQKEKQKALNTSLGLEKRKVTKVFWLEIVDIMFTKDQPEIMLFKYKYNEDFRKATFCSNKRPLREKEQAARNAEMKRYSKPCGISSQKKTDLLKLCSKNLIPNRYHQFYKELPTSSTKKDD